MNEEVPKDTQGWVQQGGGWWVYPLTMGDSRFPKTMEIVKDMDPINFGFSILFQNSIIKIHSDPFDLELICIEGSSEGAWFIMDEKVFLDKIDIPKGTEWGQMNMTDSPVICLYCFKKNRLMYSS